MFDILMTTVDRIMARKNNDPKNKTIKQNIPANYLEITVNSMKNAGFGDVPNIYIYDDGSPEEHTSCVKRFMPNATVIRFPNWSCEGFDPGFNPNSIHFKRSIQHYLSQPKNIENQYVLIMEDDVFFGNKACEAMKLSMRYLPYNFKVGVYFSTNRGYKSGEKFSNIWQYCPPENYSNNVCTVMHHTVLKDILDYKNQVQGVGAADLLVKNVLAEKFRANLFNHLPIICQHIGDFSAVCGRPIRMISGYDEGVDLYQQEVKYIFKEYLP